MSPKSVTLYRRQPKTVVLDRLQLVVPVVLGVSPTIGFIGSTVTITGYGLTGTTSVLFGSVAATITSVTDTTILVTVPAGVGLVSVTVANAIYSATVANAFTYLAALIIGGPWTIGDGSIVN